MARILYGVSGEGSGHSSRARVMGEHLATQGHELRMVSYDRGYRNLSDTFDVLEVEGLHIASSDNKVSVVKTFTDNISRLPKGFRKLNELRHSLFKEFQPDAVITDFEPMTAYLANHYDVPLISLDNQHRMRYMEYDCPEDLQNDRRVTETVIRMMVPRPDVSLVTTFYYGKPTNDRVFFFPPILRNEVRGLEAYAGEHILVYLSFGFESFLELLEHFPSEHFFVYGYDRDETVGNVTYKPFSQVGFLEDLASAKAVMATAGFTLITESLFLRKPYLAMPMAGQFEQQLNGYLLEQLQYGKNAERPTGEMVGDFLYRIPHYREQLESYKAGTDVAITEKLDTLFAADCALARDFHDRRKSS